MGKLLVAAGLGMAALGALLWAGARLSWLPIGRLPGDIQVDRPGMSFSFPIVTCIVLSVLLSLILWIVGLLRR
ncbi:MAG: DUF2905 domain-containing protein [Fimbriimonadaceae bacterium]